MTEPETRREPLPPRGRSLLGVVAYVLVPGERRRRAAGHFLRAGVEVLRGTRALTRPERTPEGAETGHRGESRGERQGERRERIEIE
jgi:hypothetical protein